MQAPRDESLVPNATARRSGALRASAPAELSQVHGGLPAPDEQPDGQWRERVSERRP
jgi:hypothetical protein